MEPAEAIRVIAESIGREARRALLSAVIESWVDDIPEHELLAALLEGRARPRPRGPLDAGRLARHARGRHARSPAPSSWSARSRALGEHKREVLKLAARFRGDEAFLAGVGEEEALDIVLPWLSPEPARDALQPGAADLRRRPPRRRQLGAGAGAVQRQRPDLGDRLLVGAEVDGGHAELGGRPRCSPRCRPRTGTRAGSTSAQPARPSAGRSPGRACASRPRRSPRPARRSRRRAASPATAPPTRARCW